MTKRETHRVDHYGDGAWYDAEYVHIRSDIPLYQDIAKSADGPVLELACGTGRLTFPMAETGANVFGVDLAPAMIERAREKLAAARPEVQARLRFELGDMRDVRLGVRFDRVVLGFNTLLHMLEDCDILAVLTTGRVHLAPRGRFHLDIFTPYPSLPERDPDGRYDPQQLIDPKTGARWVVTENNTYDPRTQVNHMRFYYQQVDGRGRPIGTERLSEIPLRVIFPRELDGFIERAGLRIAKEFEDFARSVPYAARSGLRVLELCAD